MSVCRLQVTPVSLRLSVRVSGTDLYFPQERLSLNTVRTGQFRESVCHFKVEALQQTEMQFSFVNILFWSNFQRGIY